MVTESVGNKPFNPDAVDYGKCVYNTQEKLNQRSRNSSRNNSLSTPLKPKKRNVAAIKVIKYLRKELSLELILQQFWI